VLDANGQSLAYVYARETKDAANIAKVLTEDEARRISEQHSEADDAIGQGGIGGVYENRRAIKGPGWHDVARSYLMTLLGVFVGLLGMGAAGLAVYGMVRAIGWVFGGFAAS
jgi:hypothetical protein